MIWISTPKYTVGLIVRDGVIVDAPPLARKWALGRSARKVWNQAEGYGARVRWIP